MAGDEKTTIDKTFCDERSSAIQGDISELKGDIRRVYERLNTLIMAVVGAGLSFAVATGALLLKGCS